MKVSTASDAARRLRALFQDREFFMRSQGQVRFIRVSARIQIAIAAGLALLLLVWVATMASVALSQATSADERLALREREAHVASAEGRVSAYRQDIDALAADLARRQDFIEKVTEAHLGELPEAKATETGSKPTEAVTGQPKVSLGAPDIGVLRRIEARQFAFVERLTKIADERAQRASDTIRKLGLNPGTMIASLSDSEGRGGPLLRLATGADGSVEPRFRKLGASLQRMSALERGLAGIPQVVPASMDFISSGFGYRSDPFTGEAALHAGLDFAGPYGAPIYAAAKGVVSFAGVRQGYGNVVEIDHGNGLTTRYAHMSAFRTKVGEHVEAGAAIGAIGSTGRSTGPHLHFEVRVHDRPVNPRPFLEGAAQETQHRH